MADDRGNRRDGDVEAGRFCEFRMIDGWPHVTLKNRDGYPVRSYPLSAGPGLAAPEGAVGGEEARAAGMLAAAACLGARR